MPRTNPSSNSLEQISEEEEEVPRRRIKVMIPLPVSTHPVAAIQQRSAVQRRTPSRKLEEENPNGFRSRTSSKPGSNFGATGFRGGRVAHRPWGQVVLLPHPSPTLYRWPRGTWGTIRGVGSPTWTPKPPKPSHTFPSETCHIWVLVFLPGGGFPPLGAPPPPC